MNLIERAKNIIVSPKTEWDEVLKEEDSMSKVVTSYVVPMALVPAAAAFIGYGFIGYSVPFFGKISGLSWGINYAVVSFVSSVLGVFITAFVVDMLAPSFGSQKNINRAAQLVAFAYTPAWIGGVLSILPSIALLGALFGLYGIYLMYLGFPKMMKTPEDKVAVYMVVTILILIGVYFVIGLILGLLLPGMLGLDAFNTINIR